MGDGTRRLEIMDRQWVTEGRGGSRRTRQGAREEGVPKKKKKMGL